MTTTAMMAKMAICLIRADRAEFVRALVVARFRSLRRARFPVVATVVFFRLVGPCRGLDAWRGKLGPNFDGISWFGWGEG